jgi:hypothetical protein
MNFSTIINDPLKPVLSMDQLNKLRGNRVDRGLIKDPWKRGFALFAAVSFLCPAVDAQENCPVEVKFLLSSATDAAIASFGFRNKDTGRVYFFDTESLDLLAQGVILRVRKGANNDLTVKVRRPEGKQGIDDSRLRGRFPCEIDRTQAGATVSYAVRRPYDANNLPEFGSGIHGLLSASQYELLHAARISVDWARVMRIASISLTKWETPAGSRSGKAVLELWEWPEGKLLEVSAKARSAAGVSRYAELEQLLKAKGLSLSANQDSKTSVVLEALARAR